MLLIRMTEDILAALIQAKDDSDIRAIMLTGEGLSFQLVLTCHKR